ELGKWMIMGELGLDGSVRDIPGVLPFAELAAREGFSGCIFPEGSAREAVEVDGIAVYGVGKLDDVVEVLCGGPGAERFLAARSDGDSAPERDTSPYPDFADIIGQEGAKRGAEIACSGSHNLIFIGPPGAGKSSIAKAMAGILPPMTKEEALITSKIYSIAGKGALRSGLIRQRPFRAPHYSASLTAIIGGGGADGIVPGEISLAQGGILFADEFLQMPKSVSEALRGPLEDRCVTISRLKQKVTYPASFMLVAASNPCPCGYWGEGDRCTCSEGRRQAYLDRLSGPLMDRIDLQVWTRPVSTSQIFSSPRAEPSSAVARRVADARRIQQMRFASEGISSNAEMSRAQIEKFCPLDEACRATMESLMSKQDYSMRAYFRIIKVARTIADIEEGALARAEGRPAKLDSPLRPAHLIEAAGFRFLDKVSRI
ncbi:MAG: YifB family Mg chelatase-like AAA ATPase, partial [Bacteroidales bacterium]|nr:YifB family Mg chelatase-like AAA ATPase [Candidatus Cryptobacteroides aphodequi]